MEARKLPPPDPRARRTAHADHIGYSPEARPAFGDTFVGVGQLVLLLVALDAAPGAVAEPGRRAVRGGDCGSAHGGGQGIFWALAGVYGWVALEAATDFVDRGQGAAGEGRGVGVRGEAHSYGLHS
ncbi:hypothetical protein LX36DRAFT_671768 [Colletotrichum falcatum]|nr:hypothetical protein LX36DRAFT_671768 [Colletotrichum falcatum]